MSHHAWVKTYARLTHLEPATCPRCARRDLAMVVYGDVVTRRGWGVLWCRACLHGIRLSRLDPVPASVPIRPPESAATEIPVDIRYVEDD
ncbi:MAG: hypothetical protein H6708_24515 [Kofleriaceae bacterium]|nr:hypothetical protein [Myxococcales bacterium]MCB9563574.1 hypothetical protein [Kofleriaceae bacterium]